MKINHVGMEVLCTWGIANIADGGIGYFTAKEDEWKYFHAMNALWGVVNTSIAAISLGNVRKEIAIQLNADQSYKAYKSTKKLYLINSGLDVLYLFTGLELTKYAATAKSNTALLNGFGKSIAMQGAFLLIFDSFMYSSHARYDSRWVRLMNEINLSPDGIGIRHTFK